MSQNPEIVSIMLGVISNYLTDWFRGGPKENRSASLTIVKETKDGYYKSVDYNGHPEGLSMLKDSMRNTTQLKETIIKENDEDSANTLLAIECFCQALRSEMLMWLALKKEDPNKARNYFVEAQGWVKASTREKPLERLQQEEYIKSCIKSRK